MKGNGSFVWMKKRSQVMSSWTWMSLDTLTPHWLMWTSTQHGSVLSSRASCYVSRYVCIKAEAFGYDCSPSSSPVSSFFQTFYPLMCSVMVFSYTHIQLPAEVKVGESKAQRSKLTGHLVLIMPKVNKPWCSGTDDDDGDDAILLLWIILDTNPDCFLSLPYLL